jgi:hypothetical protein
VVEGGGLENRCTGQPRIVGSNPTLSVGGKGFGVFPSAISNGKSTPKTSFFYHFSTLDYHVTGFLVLLSEQKIIKFLSGFPLHIWHNM